MNHNSTKNKPDKKNNQNNDVQFYNDTLGENASEEFNSENYSNAMKKDTRNSGIK
ncbi:hypothetical protein [Clostridium thermarum]|uniref:hypothetical protein n=1 Tax=Clostridium thermarum TaxID=1716543 RepID=UPI0013D63EB7|nr:hypothetical protein [Clostridium thermarum]